VTVQQWGIVIGVAMSGLLALGPWMFMVHAKLAVLANQMLVLCKKVDDAAEANQRLWTFYARHEAKLETQDVQLAHIGERLREL